MNISHTFEHLSDSDKMQIDLFGLYCRRCKKWDDENENVECEKVQDYLRRRAQAHAYIYTEIYGNNTP